MKIRRRWIRPVLLIVVASAILGAAFSFAQFGAAAHADAYSLSYNPYSATAPSLYNNSSSLTDNSAAQESGKRLSREDVNVDGTTPREKFEKLLTVDTDYK